MLCYGSETDKALPVQQHPILDVTKYLFDGKTLHIEIGGQQPSELHLQASSKSEAKAIMVKISDSRTIAQKAGVRVAPESSTASPHHQQQQDHEPTPVMPPRPTAAAATAASPPPEPESRPAIIMYTFAAEGGDEISVNEGDHVTVLIDDRQDGWCTVRTRHGEQGIVPETYVEMQDHDSAAPTTISEQRPSIPDPMAMQRQREEELRRRQQQEEEERAQRARERQEEEERQQAAKREQEENERRRKLQEAAQRAEVMRQRQLQQNKATVSYTFKCCMFPANIHCPFP